MENKAVLDNAAFDVVEDADKWSFVAFSTEDLVSRAFYSLSFLGQ